MTPRAFRNASAALALMVRFMRRSARAVCIVLIVPAIASAQSTSDSANRTAYDFALRCFVANQQDEASQRVAYNAVIRLGRLRGISDRQVRRDFNAAIATEAIRIARSDAYHRQLLSDCRRLGLSS